MRISTNTFYQQGLSSILRNQADTLKTQQQVGSGRRVLTPADDPVAAAQALDVAQADAINTQYGANRSTAADTLSLVETNLGQVSNVIQNARTIAVQAGNTILSDADRKALAAQLSSLQSELMGSANATDTQGRYLFAGFQSLSQPFTESATGVQYNGDDGQRLIQVDSSRQIDVSASGADIFMRIASGNGFFTVGDSAGNVGGGIINPGSVTNPANLTGHDYSITFSVGGGGAITYDVMDTTTNTAVLSAQPYTSGASIRFDGMDIAIQGTPSGGDSFTVGPARQQSIFKTLQDMIDLLKTPTSGGTAHLTNGIKQGLANLDQALSNVLTQRGTIGAKLKEIESLQTVGDSRSLQYKQTLSRLQDVDLASAISQLTQQQIYLQAAQKSYAQVTGMSLFQYLNL